MNEAMIQPAAGASAPLGDMVPQPPSRQVAKMITSSKMAIAGVGDWLYWKLPIRPWTAPRAKSAAYAKAQTARLPALLPGSVPMIKQITELRELDRGASPAR